MSMIFVMLQVGHTIGIIPVKLEVKIVGRWDHSELSGSKLLLLSRAEAASASIVSRGRFKKGGGAGVCRWMRQVPVGWFRKWIRSRAVPRETPAAALFALIFSSWSGRISELHLTAGERICTDFIVACTGHSNWGGHPPTFFVRPFGFISYIIWTQRSGSFPCLLRPQRRSIGPHRAVSLSRGRARNEARTHALMSGLIKMYAQFTLVT